MSRHRRTRRERRRQRRLVCRGMQFWIAVAVLALPILLIVPFRRWRT